MGYLVITNTDGEHVDINLNAISYVTTEQETNNYQLHFNNQQTITIHSAVYWKLLEPALYPEDL